MTPIDQPPEGAGPGSWLEPHQSAEVERLWRKAWDALRFSRSESGERIARGGISHHGLNHLGESITATLAEAKARRLLRRLARRSGRPVDWTAVRSWQEECHRRWRSEENPPGGS